MQKEKRKYKASYTKVKNLKAGSIIFLYGEYRKVKKVYFDLDGLTVYVEGVTLDLSPKFVHKKIRHYKEVAK